MYQRGYEHAVVQGFCSLLLVNIIFFPYWWMGLGINKNSLFEEVEYNVQSVLEYNHMRIFLSPNES